MAIVRVNPWNMSQLSHYFDEADYDVPGYEQSSAIDVYENNEDVIVKAVLPGYKEEDIKITVEGATLTIRASAQEEKEIDAKKKYYRKEIRIHSLVRSVTLPTHVSNDRAEASYTNGILMLTLPKAEEAKPKEISFTRK